MYVKVIPVHKQNSFIFSDVPFSYAPLFVRLNNMRTMNSIKYAQKFKIYHQVVGYRALCTSNMYIIIHILLKHNSISFV